MRKSFKYRLYPNSSQKKALQNMLESCRLVYNKALEVRKAAWEEKGETVSRYDTSTLLTQWRSEDNFLAKGSAQVMQDVLKRVDLALRLFFRHTKPNDKKFGFPRFKSQSRYDSFTYPQDNYNWRFLPNGRVHLSKIGGVKINLHRPIEGKAKTLTIRRDGVGNWYACFSCVVEVQPLPLTDRVTGVDFGLVRFGTLSDGSHIPNPRFFKVDEKALASVQRRFSREDHTNKSACYRHKQAINHVYQRITNRRKNFAHQESRKLVNTYQLIAFEDINIDRIHRGNFTSINRSINDVAWSQFIRFTMSKAEGAGRRVVLVDRHNTSETCSNCGEIVSKSMAQRVHICPKCNLVLDRDHNAALNILARGLAGMGANP